MMINRMTYVLKKQRNIKGMTKVSIAFDNDPNTIYPPGSWITGRVIIDTNKPIRTRGIRLSFTGREKTSWKVRHNKHTVHHQETINIFDINMTLFGTLRGQEVSDNALQEIMPGNSTFPFQIQVPENQIPPNLFLSYGNIKYKLSAYIDIPRWPDTKSPIYPINIFPPVFANAAHLLQSLVTKSDHVIGCFSNRGIIAIQGSIPKIGFLLGETVDMLFAVCNNSTRTIKSISVYLKQDILYRAHGYSKHQSIHIVTDNITQTIAPQSPQIEVPIRVTIPQNIAPTTFARLITLKYYLTVEFNAGCCNTMRHNFEIVVGNALLNTPAVNQGNQAQIPSRIEDVTFGQVVPHNPETANVELPPYQDMLGTGRV